MTQDPRILIVSALRNEGPYILDWIAHLIGAGATDFLLYSNDCEDGTDDILSLLDRAGVVTHVSHTPEPGTSIQWQVFRQARKHELRKQADWVLVCDVDEYVNIHIGAHRFADLLAAVPGDTDAIALAWRLFGNNGVTTFADAPVTEQFTRSMSASCSFPIASTFFKTLFRASGPFNQLGVHRPSQKRADRAAPPVWVDGAGQRLPDRFAQTAGRLSLLGTTMGRSLAELNHYSLRSAEGFLIKRARGLPNHREQAIDLGYWVQRNFNTDANDSIRAMAPATAAAKATLLAHDGVAQAHARAVAWHRTRIQELRKGIDGHTIYAQLCLAGDSRELTAQEAGALYAEFQSVT